jgi:isobutyryl-CoA mutase
MTTPVEVYKPKNHIRIVTAASLFDGHDAAINIMRRIIQSTGCEVIHLGHNRSVQEIVDCAIQEDVQAIAITSYQGGHVEFFKYMYDLLRERGAGHVKIFGGGGGTILPEEIKELHGYGITRIYAPDDGRSMGLQGMINDLVQKCDFPIGDELPEGFDLIQEKKEHVARAISAFENFPENSKTLLESVRTKSKAAITPVLGITGTGGAGKSSLVDELVRRFIIDFEDKTLAIISVDPSKRKTGGALLGDRIRMNAIHHPRVFMRSLATRQSNLALSKYVQDAVDTVKAAGFDMVILETSGIGQSDTEIIEHSDLSLYVMTPEYGAASQLEKIDMLDFADVIALNKFDKRGALDAIRDVKKQFKRNHNLWDVADETLPVFGTIASQFNDPGMNQLYRALIGKVAEKFQGWESTSELVAGSSEKIYIIPPARTRYLSEITENNRNYDKWVEEQKEIAQQLYSIQKSIEAIKSTKVADVDRLTKELQEVYAQVELNLDPKNKKWLEEWPTEAAKYQDDFYIFKVRDKEIKIQTYSLSLSNSRISKVALPKYEAWGELLKWGLRENVPGQFPYTAGVFPFKREGEDPTRMFAGEGGPERTNKRFHYVSKGMPAKRLSTAFDSVTLYGEDPDYRPDIFGKIGNSGVNICCLDDAKKLYSGFNLVDPMTSVSMTINGPAATMTAFFMNAAIDQQCEVYIKANGLEDEITAKIDSPSSRKKDFQDPLTKE